MLIDDEADRLLRTWSIWAGNESATRGGFPTRSVGFATGGSGSADAFDQMCDAADKQQARAIDTVLDSLPSYAKVAIYKFYLQDGELTSTPIESAALEFLAAAKRRGVAP